MSKPTTFERGLVSVIIPCYNHGRYLTKAIQSIYAQSYQFFEIIVVDDGSGDHTKDVCLRYPSVKYIYQLNAGLSAARNNGISNSSGEYFIFLDADDWLLENAIISNLDLLTPNNNVAFVSGGHKVYYEPKDTTMVVQEEVNENHYCRLLEGNFIGMHATVMYQRWIFDTYHFDASLPYCEDYDLYLKIARHHPIIHHTGLIAVYRIHDNNMSSNYPKMMKYALLVLSAQKKYLKTSAEKESILRGVASWKSYYSEKIIKSLRAQLYSNKLNFKKEEIRTLKKNSPLLYIKFKTEIIRYLLEKISKKVKYYIKKMKLRNIFKSAQKKAKNMTGKIPSTGKIGIGDLNRTTPFSTQFGYDRGGPLDRYYIENFLNENSSLIGGRVLEIGDNVYTLKYGGSNVTKSDILHIDDSNEQATFVGDLSNAPHIPSNTFDCIVLTQTLHLIYDFKGAIETCYRLLKQGGTLLITVPGISHIAQDGWGKYWLWSFTDASMQRIMEESFPTEKISIKTFGNVLVASAFLYGMGFPEIKKEQLDQHDPHYQVIITVRAIK